MRGILLETGHEPESRRRTQSLILADHRTRTLAGAAGWIITLTESTRPEYVENAALGFYIYHNFRHLYTEDEQRYLNAAMKALKGPSWGSDPLLNPDRHHPVTEHILKVGLGAYQYEVAQRILAEHGEAVFVNRCETCGQIVRTPIACLCTWCGHSWYERREELRERARSSVYNPTDE